MRMDKLTNPLQNVLADAQSLAVGRDQQFIEPIHMLKALLDQSGGSAVPLLQKAGANGSQLAGDVNDALSLVPTGKGWARRCALISRLQPFA